MRAGFRTNYTESRLIKMVMLGQTICSYRPLLRHAFMHSYSTEEHYTVGKPVRPSWPLKVFLRYCMHRCIYMRGMYAFCSEISTRIQWITCVFYSKWDVDLMYCVFKLLCCILCVVLHLVYDVHFVFWYTILYQKFCSSFKL